MFAWFTWLQSNVFYPVSEFFGTLGGIAMMRPDSFIELLGRAIDGEKGLSMFINVFNIWEGVDSSNVDLLFRGFRIDFDIFTSGFFKILGIPLYNLLQFSFAGFGQFPMVFALALAIAKWGLLISAVKFFWGSLSKLFS